MKLVWNEPSNNMHWEQAVRGWLNCMGVYFEPGREHWICEYNYVHHFFDIHIYECWLPNRGEPDAAIKSMRDYLENSDLIWEEFPTYRWDNGKQRPGVRFWVFAEDFQRK